MMLLLPVVVVSTMGCLDGTSSDGCWSVMVVVAVGTKGCWLGRFEFVVGIACIVIGFVEIECAATEAREDGCCGNAVACSLLFWL